MTFLTDARREALAKVLLGLFLAVTMLFSAAGAAEARNGADDPPGDDRGGHGTDDPAGHVRGGPGKDDRGGDDRGGHGRGGHGKDDRGGHGKGHK
jgi:hypothetical protein